MLQALIGALLPSNCMKMSSLSISYKSLYLMVNFSLVKWLNVTNVQRLNGQCASTKWGYPNSVVYNRKSPLQMDDLGVAPWRRKPPDYKDPKVPRLKHLLLFAGIPRMAQFIVFNIPGRLTSPFQVYHQPSFNCLLSCNSITEYPKIEMARLFHIPTIQYMSILCFQSTNYS